MRTSAMTFSFTQWVDRFATVVANSAMIALLPIAAVTLLVHPF